MVLRAEWIADQIDHYVKSGQCTYADMVFSFEV